MIGRIHPSTMVLALAALLLSGCGLVSGNADRATVAGVPNADNAPRPTIHVYKQATCGCCRTWVKYLEANGFPVTVTDTTALVSIRAKHHVPPALAGCHTAVVDGYVIEGHVSVEEIERLLRDRPAIRGLVVPGMPKGAPGMERGGGGPYDVLALDKSGATTVFAHHPATTDSAGGEAADSAR